MMAHIKIVIISILLALSAAFAEQLTIKDQLTGKVFGSTPVYLENSVELVSVQEFVHLLSLTLKFNEQTKKINFTLNKHQVEISAFSPFMRIGSTIQQNLYTPLYRNEDILVPINTLINMLNACQYSFTFLEKNYTFLLPLLKPNITQIAFSADSVESHISLITMRNFSKDEIRIENSQDWTYITIENGIFPARDELNFQLSDRITDCIPIQLTPESARLTLKIDPEYEISDVAIQDQKNIHLTISKLPEHPSVNYNDLLVQEKEKWKIDTIIIDPGHGGRDPGAIGADGTYEKHITLAIAQAIKAELENNLDVAVVMTRNSDVLPTLKGRTATANQAGGKLLISIHVDANRARWLRGHTVYFMGPAKTEEARLVAQKENSAIQFEDSQSEYLGLSDASMILAANAQNSYNKESQELAAYISDEMAQECGSKSLGVRQAGFYVLYGASMPNVLLETGFITNTADKKNLLSKSYQKRIAKSVCKAVQRFKQHYESAAL